MASETAKERTMIKMQNWMQKLRGELLELCNNENTIYVWYFIEQDYDAFHVYGCDDCPVQGICLNIFGPKEPEGE